MLAINSVGARLGRPTRRRRHRHCPPACPTRAFSRRWRGGNLMHRAVAQSSITSVFIAACERERERMRRRESAEALAELERRHDACCLHRATRRLGGATRLTVRGTVSRRGRPNGLSASDALHNRVPSYGASRVIQIWSPVWKCRAM